jgi:hypothetical protein
LVRVRPHCRFKNRGSGYLSESGMKWMSRWCKATMRPGPRFGSTQRTPTRPASRAGVGSVACGLGRIVALRCRSSALCHTH